MGSLSKSGARSPRSHPLRPANTNPARYKTPISGAAISVPIPAATITYPISPPTKLPIAANSAARTARPRSRLHLGIFVTRCATRPPTRATTHWKTARKRMNRATMTPAILHGHRQRVFDIMKPLAPAVEDRVRFSLRLLARSNRTGVTAGEHLWGHESESKARPFALGASIFLASPSTPTWSC
jgi:hypothetical protein